jgi:hypothetical protein
MAATSGRRCESCILRGCVIKHRARQPLNKKAILEAYEALMISRKGQGVA